MDMREKPEPFVRHGMQELTGVGSDELLDAIANDQDIDLRGVSIYGDIDLGEITDRIELDGLDRPLIKGKISISNSKFHDKVGFGSCVFAEEMEISFTYFNEKVRFHNACFYGKADFNASTFCGEADFSSVIFNNYSNFDGATFNQGTTFESSTFCMYAQLGADYNSDNTNFRLAVFNSPAEFINARFGKADFGFATFNGIAMFSPATLKTAQNLPAPCLEGMLLFSPVFLVERLIS